MPRRTHRKIQNPIPLTLGEFVIAKVRELEAQNATLGTITEGIWQESEKGEYWDVIRTGNIFEDPKFITIESIEREWKFSVEQLENRMMCIGVW
jgi:hypothetical protein